MKKSKRTNIECPHCIEGLVIEINGKLFCEDCTKEVNNNMKILNNEEINDLIKGIEDGDIIIDGRNAPEWTEKEKEDYKKLRQEHSDAMTYDEKEEIKKLVEKLRKEDEEK